jgi:subtilisin-like proprotein convertase family protein
MIGVTSPLASPREHWARRPRRAHVTIALVTTLLAACGSEPRYGVLSMSAAAPRATLSGHTSAQASPALELSPGCPGFVDPASPEHVLRVTDGVPFVVSVSSPNGPLALAVSGAGEVRCDSDGGAGHRPHVSIDQPGDYVVHVGALSAPQDLAYELVVAPSSDVSGTGGAPVAEDTRVSVTVTSEPPGATVRTPEGEVLGTTPAMFVLPVPGDQVGQERRFVLEMPGHRTAEVTGRLLGGSMVLHASLLAGTETPPPSIDPSTDPGTPPTPGTQGGTQGELTIATTDPVQNVRDYTTVEQHVDVAQDCTIGRAAVVLDLQHSYVADLRVALRAPSGTEVVLHNHQSGSRRSLSTTIDWDDRRGVLHTLAGQNARGRWTLTVRDSVGADSGTLHTFSMRFTCGSTDTTSTQAAPAAGGSRARTYGRGTRAGTSATQHGIISPWSPSTPAPQQPVAPPTTGRSNPRTRTDGVVDPWGG